MRVDHDKEVDAAYITLAEIRGGDVTKTVTVTDSINLDFDSDGKLVGIEVLAARSLLRDAPTIPSVPPRARTVPLAVV